MRPRGYVVFATMLAATPLVAQQDSTWRDHDRAARDARVRGDWTASRGHVERMEATLSGHPAVIAALARASAHLGDTARVVAELERLAAEGVSYDVEADTQLAIVRHAPAGAPVMAKLRANLAPVGTCRLGTHGHSPVRSRVRRDSPAVRASAGRESARTR